jgi:3-oxoacyl-[acyl-carrier protein] reductase
MSEAARLAVVSGSSGEIGFHLVAHFVDAGWKVVGIDKQPARPDVPSPVVSLECDLANATDAASALDEAMDRCGVPDVLVNCAGLIANSPLVSLGANGWQVHDRALWDAVIASGLTSAFTATSYCVRRMLRARKRGVVINVSSVCAHGNPGQVAYSAAKAGLNGLTLALAKELAPFGIRVVGLAPGYFDTASTTRNVAATRLAKIVAAVPLKRLGRVNEIAGAVDFIVGNDYVNGTILELDGGLVV